MKSVLNNYEICGYDFGVKTFYSDFHLGWDMCSPDKRVFAPLSGVIDFARDYDPYDPKHPERGGQGGRMIVLRATCPIHSYVILRFLHLSEIHVEQGQSVKEGDVIGIMGNTGLSTKEHLHYDESYAPFNLYDKSNFIKPHFMEYELKDKYKVKVWTVGQMPVDRFLNSAKEYYSPATELEFFGNENLDSNLKFDYHTQWGKAPNPFSIKEGEEDIALVLVDYTLWKPEEWRMNGIAYGTKLFCAIFPDSNMSNGKHRTTNVVLHELRHAFLPTDLDDTHAIIKVHNNKHGSQAWKYPVDYLQGLKINYATPTIPMQPEPISMQTPLTKEQAGKLCWAVFHREADQAFLDHFTGKTLDQALTDISSSQEWNRYSPLIRSAQEIEKWAYNRGKNND